MTLIQQKTRQGFQWPLIKQELKSITTVDLTCKALNFVEKILWIALATIGIFWAIYFISIVIKDENPIVKTIMDKPLTETEKPAITICPQGSTRFAIAERLGNFLETKEALPKNIEEWQNLMLMCSTIFSTESFSFFYSKRYFENYCLKTTEMNEACKVSKYTQKTKKHVFKVFFSICR